MKIGRYVIGLLLGLTILISFGLLFGTNSDSDRYYDVVVDPDDEFGLADVGNKSSKLIAMSEDLKTKMTITTDSSLADIIGSIMSAGLAALDLVYETISMPFTVLNTSLSKIFGIPEIFIKVAEGVILFTIIFTLIRIKVKSDAA